MSITIVKPGLLTTIQDNGRWGFQHLGINPGGAMDLRALQIANTLLLNDLSEAVIEFYFPAPIIRFNQAAFIALSGADFNASINGISIPINQPIYVPENSTIQFNNKINGKVGYLAVQGGFALTEWMNSFSTNLKVGAGGFEGRALTINDEIFFTVPFRKSKKSTTCTILPWKADTKAFYTTEALQFIPGNEFNLLTEVSKQLLLQESFTILPKSDRMGYCLNGPSLSRIHSKEMISSAVTRGTIQLLPNGQCIILMADHQTTGGYPRIGHIISAHLPSIAQKEVGTEVQFKLTDLPTAENFSLLQAQHLHQLKNACNLQLDAYHRH